MLEQMTKTFRSNDKAIETELAKFLDEHFYPRFVTNFHRYTDRDSQLHGLDVHFDYNSHTKMLVDEKAQTHYINKQLPTFAFEVNFVNSAGLLNVGWLLDEKKLTRYYALMWIQAKKDKRILATDITEVEIIVIERSKILFLLAGHGYDKYKTQLTAARIRLYEESGKQYEGKRPFYFYYTPQLAERPVNIVIKKPVLEEMAFARFIVKPL